MEMIALILTKRGPKGMPTLIVANAGVLKQWKAEIKKYIADAAELSVLVYYGPEGEQNAQKLREYDIVITSYNLMANEAKDVRVGKPRKSKKSQA